MAQNTPDFVLERANQEVKRANILYEQAKKRVPAAYQDFLVLLDQNPRLFNKEFPIDDQARALGVWSSAKGTYVTIQLPYMTVDGRVQMARDEHKKANKKLDILPAKMGDTGKALTVTVESELYGTASGSCLINTGGGGVDRTNPLENAETSAIGRALGFLGYGLIGTGIASADEIENAREASASAQPSEEQKGQDRSEGSKNKKTTGKQKASKPKTGKKKTTSKKDPESDHSDGLAEKQYILQNYESGKTPQSGVDFAKITVEDQQSKQSYLVLAKGEDAVRLAGQIPEDQPFMMGVYEENEFLFLRSVNGQTVQETEGAA